MNDALEGIVRTEVEAIGFELVELRRGGSRSRPVYEVRIDRHSGNGVTVDDCARVSRAIEARFDAGGVVEENYDLQVSSPGERPLRTPADWKRCVGRWALVKSPVLPGGKAEVEVLDVQGSDEYETAIVRASSGKEYHVPLAGVTEARLAFHL